MKNRKKSTRQLVGIEDITAGGVQTADGELTFYLVQPTNLNVLPEQGVRSRVMALLNVLKAMAEIELLALDSKESFQDNRQFYRQRLEQDGNPAIRRLLAQDRQHLDDTQAMMASSRESTTPSWSSSSGTAALPCGVPRGRSCWSCWRSILNRTPPMRALTLWMAHSG